ncbi:hypothetical protein N7509_004114 [Penicillium cosmopolitanum]|uniref:BTB domain-containing protein n=1 Tax=Penicillium cosmopolitanum TaxID=1131564 RepID=A0A9W9W6Q2_9EURO|nr:uncharacterized protein N7509_004114 [Penicillium cosmopolitanum]KAJ5404243.1 hypothetical protein N7509_004114 [Penicillium cosmopolitanum]
MEKLSSLNLTTTPTHILDPDGEVIIILRNADAPFAYEPEEIPGKTPEKTEKTAEEPASDETTPQEPSAVKSEPRIQVSAKHMIFASSFFKKSLTGGWKETKDLQQGSVEIIADDWDLQAFMIVLYAIHGQFKKVPQTVSVEILAKVAVIVDYYDCKDVLYLLQDKWIDSLAKLSVIRSSRDLMLRLWISYFFQLSTNFKELTSSIMSSATDSIVARGLPIPATFIGKEEHNTLNY